MLISSWDNNQFFENFSKELIEIERINDRVEREIDQKINQRIQRYGVDSKRILGRDIQLPPRSLVELRSEYQPTTKVYQSAPKIDLRQEEYINPVE